MSNTTVRMVDPDDLGEGWLKLAEKLEQVVADHGDVDGWVPIGHSLNVVFADPNTGHTRVCGIGLLMPPADPDADAEEHGRAAHSIAWMLMRTVSATFQEAIDDSMAPPEEADGASR